MGVRVRGRRTGVWHELPVQYARDEDDLVVWPGHPERKTWWRNLAEPSPVQVLVAGSWRQATGRVVRPGDPAYDRSVDAYRRRFERSKVPPGAPLVRFVLAQ
jgi:hypothetical protein